MCVGGGGEGVGGGGGRVEVEGGGVVGGANATYFILQCYFILFHTISGSGATLATNVTE